MPVAQMIKMCNRATSICRAAQHIVKCTFLVIRYLIRGLTICSSDIGSIRLQEKVNSVGCDCLPGMWLSDEVDGQTENHH